jgi:hypothetical protein
VLFVCSGSLMQLFTHSTGLLQDRFRRRFIERKLFGTMTIF